MKLHLKLFGNCVNTYPMLSIKQNNKLLEFEIVDNKELNLDLKNTTFTLGMSNKLFGQNRIWDTVLDSQGNIIADKNITINCFEIDDVDIVHLLKKLDYVSKEHGSITVDDACIRYNGHWEFSISENPYDWIIDTNTKRTNEYRDTSYFSDFTILNNYTDHYHYINKIKNLLDI